MDIPPDDTIPEDLDERVLWHLKRYLQGLMHRHDDMAGLDEGVYTVPVKNLIKLIEILEHEES